MDRRPLDAACSGLMAFTERQLADAAPATMGTSIPDGHRNISSSLACFASDPSRKATACGNDRKSPTTQLLRRGASGQDSTPTDTSG